MGVQITTRWLVPVRCYSDVEVFVGNEVVVEQGEQRLRLNKAECADLIEAIRLAAETAPDESEEIPF